MSNILFITNSLNKGGASKRVLLMQKIIGLDRFHIFSTILSKELKDRVVNHNYLKLGLFSFISNLKKLSHFINENDIDIIATNSRKYYFLCYLIGFLKSQVTYKSIVQIVYRNVFPFQKKVQGSEILSVSDAVSNYLINDVGITKNKISLIKNTVVPIKNVNKTGHNDIYSKIGVSKGSIVFTCIARYDPVKGHDLLLDCFANVVDENKNLYLVLMGYGELKVDLIKKIKCLNIQDNVVMLPSDFSINEVLSITDISILLSKREGLSTFILESMSLGLPIIASNIPGNDELVNNNENGYLVDFNIDEVSNKIILLSNKQYLRDNMGEASKLRYNEEFSFETYQNKIKKFFK